jgi:RimJ/RimL family protein N-acetyltransferase
MLRSVDESPRLAGERVRLAALREDDSDRMFEWINDRELVELSAAFRPIEREDHDRWFDRIRDRDEVAIFGIRFRDCDRLIGSCQLHGIDRRHSCAELQIRIGERSAWGRGLGREATELLLGYGFEGLQLHRIQLHVERGNERARRMYGRVGFREEGILRGAALIGGRRRDLVVMGILRTDRAR